ncbi:MBL fold metallo-hydrolase [Bradyrhizobium sp. DOA9]|uniref:MBL fold metallo-hydrolase n=1 Tax=Bradyrhizobium sp. DOA9 TaxID=1126627 RepID=UPI000468D1BE|nr:MBL fold metallo-hydrolase [Bradyrhizobium sp. DOA9]
MDVFRNAVRHERRRLLKLPLLGALAAALPASAKAEDMGTPPTVRPMPLVDARFPAEMAPGIFIVPDRRIPLVPNIGIIVGRDAVLVIDCGLGLENTDGVSKLARQLAPGRQVLLTITHTHPEHGSGAQVFKPDARILYNRDQRDYLLRTGANQIDAFRHGFLPSDQAHLLDGIVITPPDETYEGSKTIDLGGRKVEFRTRGTAHSPGDQIIILPEEKIVFAGDLIEERMFPIIPFFPPMVTQADIDVERWESILIEMRALKPRFIVPGHGNLGGPEIIDDVLNYFKDLKLLAHNRSADELRNAIRAKYPTWENDQFISPAVQYFLKRS